MSETDLCDNQVQPLSEKVDLQRKTIDTLAAQLAAESQLKEAAEKAIREVAVILGPPGTTAASASDVIKWANFAAIGLKIANDGLGEYRLRYEAAEARVAGLALAIEKISDGIDWTITNISHDQRAYVGSAEDPDEPWDMALKRVSDLRIAVHALLAPAAEEGGGDGK